MKRLLHELWPLAAVVALTVTLALQIPRKALFFTPEPVAAPAPYATFVTYDDTAYEALRQKVRMAWQMRGPAGAAIESRVDAFALMDDETPAFAPLPLPRTFAAPWKGTAAAPTPAAPLLPPSVADRAALAPVATAPDAEAEAKAALRADLLAFPEEDMPSR